MYASDSKLTPIACHVQKHMVSAEHAVGQRSVFVSHDEVVEVRFTFF